MNGKKLIYLAAATLTIGWTMNGVAGAVDDSMRQLGRGIANITVGVIEIPESILEVQEQDGEVAAITYGALRGVWRFIAREGVGVFEVVTFPVRFDPIIRPEFPARNGIVNTVIEANELPDDGEIQDWEIRGLRLNR